MSNLRTFDLNLLLAFDVLMRERNVTRAAECMFVTQSAMSHTLHRLRQQLDDPVLVKSPAGMQPTALALALVEPVHGLLREMERLLESPQAFDPSSSQRRFTIAATDYMEFLLLPELSGLIDQAAPGVDIHVKRTDSAFPLAQLENGSLDVVLGFASMLEPPAHLRCEHLFVDRMACVVRENHPTIHNAPSLDDYLAMAHMLISRTGSRVGFIDAKLAELGLERRIKLIVPHFLSAPLMVAQTDLILSLPYRLAAEFQKLVTLNILPVPIDLPDYELVMIWHPLWEKDPAHCWLRAQISAIGRKIDANEIRL
ncbi:LysR family transcriptional regulator [Methylomonas rosea]|uniref:LysR family transcriptional regulator n=1 Tax=Methylomonas rosea TaxID=2952227 RepID=A0ABT1TVH1_9GAMM|nr:LysR family transcriptional regulator [Methylomonas sp. WSC-7]MCQ8118766.1 LysR family transcriptional regulator [Methylomonas sp. WSC-7]